MKSTSVSARPELIATLIRLMLSVNDIAIAADTLIGETSDERFARSTLPTRGIGEGAVVAAIQIGPRPQRSKQTGKGIPTDKQGETSAAHVKEAPCSGRMRPFPAALESGEKSQAAEPTTNVEVQVRMHD
jgi:hypothetical protein